MHTVAAVPPFLPRTIMVARSLSSSRSFSCTALAKPLGAASTHTSLMGSCCRRLMIRAMAAGAEPTTISLGPGTDRP